MRPPLRIALLFLGLVLLVQLCRHLGLAELTAAVRRADPVRFGAFLALTLAVFAVFALRWAVVLRAMSGEQARPAFGTLMAFRAAEHAVSTLLPSAHLSGEPVRALLLRRRGIDWVLAVSSISMDRMLEMTASSIAGPIYVGVFFLANDVTSPAAPWLFAVMCLATLALCGLYVHVYRGSRLLSALAGHGLSPRMAQHLDAIERRLRSFLHTPSLAAGLALSFLAELLVLAELWMLASAFALPISLPTLIGVMVGMGIAQLVPVPAAIGSLEATEVAVLALAGGAAPLGLAVGLIIRLRETLWIVAGLGALYLEGLSWRGLELPAGTIAGNASTIDPNE